MSVLAQNTDSVEGGFEKTIDAGALPLMLQILQGYQYQYPIRSAIRELASNGLDSISEKNVAKKILKGEARVEDFFEPPRPGELYKDSKWDPSYYNLKYLSNIENVIVIYHAGSGPEKDRVTITDHGVGLGGKRLEKYFSLGYSTKRLSKLPLGKFGLGNKSPLAINKYYTVESVYEGRLFRFNVYMGKVENLIPEFNFSKNAPNQYVEFEETFVTDPNTGAHIKYRAYYEEVNEPNRLTVTIEAKKNHRGQYLDAVKNQLLYFPNVKLYVEEEGELKEETFGADIMFEDKNIILSRNEVWTKPHILINKVNYGNIQFDELELQAVDGNIGFKVEQEEVEVSPNRESLVWSDQTKQTVLRCFQQTVSTATKLIEKELNEKDFIKWLKVCYLISSKSSYFKQDTVLGRLVNIVDLSQVQPVFQGNELIKFTKHWSDGLNVKRVWLESRKTDKGKKSIVERTYVEGLSYYTNCSWFIIRGHANFRKDKFLLSTVGQFITFKEPAFLEEPDLQTALEMLLKEIGINLVKDNAKWAKMTSDDWLERQYHRLAAVWKAMTESKELLIYEDVEVPEEYSATDKEEDFEIEEEAKVQKEIADEARRKVQGKILLQTPSSRYQNTDFARWEINVSEISEWDADEVYYGNQNDADTLDLVKNIISTDNHPTDKTKFEEKYLERYHTNAPYGAHLLPHLYLPPSNTILVQVSQTHNKLFLDYKHVSRFFMDIQNKRINMSLHLIRWNTARQLREKLARVSFLYNFPLSPKRMEQYHELQSYVNKYYTSLGSNVAIDTLVSHLDKVQQFQLFVQSSDDPEQIAQLAKELWNNSSLTDGQALDMDVYNKMEELWDWAIPIAPICNSISLFTGLKPTNTKEEYNNIDYWHSAKDQRFVYIPDEFELEIRKVITDKGVTLQ